MNEYESEPIPGLPEFLPKGETLIWQGSPSLKQLATHAFHVRLLAIYFSVLIVWRIVLAVTDGQSAAQAITSSLWLVPVAAAALGLLTLMAWLICRSTIYTVTSRRIVLRFGVAIPMMVNIPFNVIEAAGLRIDADGNGDIPLQLMEGDRLAYLHLWPHARPWRLAHPQPMFRAIPDAAKVGEIVSRALSASVAGGPLLSAFGAQLSAPQSRSNNRESQRLAANAP